MINEEKQKEFEKAAKLLIRFLRRNYHPHVAVFVVRRGLQRESWKEK
jgi:hypothetical protein